MEKKKTKVITANSKKRWVNVSLVLSIILVILGLFTLFATQKSIKEPQELRQQASVADGQVTMAFEPATGAKLLLGEEAQIDFQINTNQVQIDGVQLVFNIVTDTLITPPDFQLDPNVGLQVIYQEVEQVADGYLVSVALFPDTISSTSSFSTADYTTIGSLVFNPSISGQVEINFDVENSLGPVHDSDPVEDELRHIETLTYSVLEAHQNTSPSILPSASPEESILPSASPEESVLPSASPEESVLPSASPDDNSNGLGGVVSCNESCSSNNECAVNHRCYNGQCRLVTNVTSDTCSVVSNPDYGIARGCNEYCADNNECAAGYSCYFNRCRNPLNLESTSCAAPSRQVYQAMTSSCNQACATHKDCAANLLCYGPSNTCRLASNPGSISCTPASYSTVSNMYSTKGGLTTGSDTNTDSDTTSQSSVSPQPSSSPIGMVKSPDTDSELPIKDETALDTVGSYFDGLLKDRGISLPFFLIAGGSILLLIVIVLSVIGRVFGGNSAPPKVTLPQRDTKKDQQYQDQLAQKINTLQNQPPSAPAPQMPLQTRPPMTPTTQAPVIRTQSAAPVASPPVPGNQPPVPQAPQSSSSSMLDRVKNKGIKPPQ